MESSAVASTKHNDERSMATTTICHILPCSIDQDITAPIAQYFHPTTLNLDNILPNVNKKKKDASTTTTTTTTTTTNTVMAAQFRGRGLLCAVDTPASLLASSATTTIANDNSIQVDDSKSSSNANEEGMTMTATTTLSKLPSNVMGVVLAPSSSSSTTTATTTTTTTNNLKVIETFHEIYNWQHEHDVQKVILESRQLNNEKYGLHAVQEWCDLAQSIHDPITVSPPP